MSYEFETGVQGDALPRIPDFWGATGRIEHVVPGDPVFIHFNSVIADPKTEHIAVDTHDRLPNQSQPNFSWNGHIGLLRVAHIEPPIDGYIVDLRYCDRLTERMLGLIEPAEVPEPIAQENIDHKMRAVLGPIFVGLGTDLIHFPCEEKNEAILQPYAIALMEFVDAERKRRGAEVIGEIIEPASQTAPTRIVQD